MSLLACARHCDLTDRDFSGCEMPYACLNGRDFSKSNIYLTILLIYQMKLKIFFLKCLFIWIISF
jgi:hypothetical protein